MTIEETAAEFLRRHKMHYDCLTLPEWTARYRQEMDAGLRGEPSSLAMLPSFLRLDRQPRRGEPVLILDAGGTNLRCARAMLDEEGRVVTELLQKRRMPGTNGTVTARELFRQIAMLAREAAEGCEWACISFSYACEILPNGDGVVLELGKELSVECCVGLPVCENLERELKALGVSGHRRWRLINDAVGSLLGGMAAVGQPYDDYIGLIVGTGLNVCCPIAAERIEKSPRAAALGGDVPVNLECGCFGLSPRGEADRRVDAESEKPGDHLTEKMIAGRYYPRVLKKTLQIACEEGLLPAGLSEPLQTVTLHSYQVDQFYRNPEGDDPLSRLLLTSEQRRFAAEVNRLLLRRAALLAAGCISAILEERARPPGSRVCVCGDGSMLRRSPALLPMLREWLREPEERLGLTVDFFFPEDASLLGCVWAGLAGA